MRASTKTLREQKNESAKAMNFYAASFGKGPTFDLEPETVSRPRAKPHPGPEAGVLAAVLKLLAVHPAVAWARRMNTGAVKVGEGRAVRFVRFGFVGCADILGQMKDGRLLAIECKSDVGRLSDAQQNFLATVAAHGGVAGVARSIDDALAILKAGQGACSARGFPSGGPHAQPPITADEAPDTSCATVTRKP